MGTNYYVKYHIGKASYGWPFALHIEPGTNLKNLNDVKKILSIGTITDEDGKKVSADDMVEIIGADYDLVTGDFC